MSAVFHLRVLQRSEPPKFIELCVETPCLCPSGGHKHGGRKVTKTSVIEFCYSRAPTHENKCVFSCAFSSSFDLRASLFREPFPRHATQKLGNSNVLYSRRSYIERSKIELNRTQSNSIHGLSSIEFGNRTKSNTTHSVSSISEQIEFNRTNRTQSNSIRLIEFD